MRRDEKVRSRETRGRGRPEPASGATARTSGGPTGAGRSARTYVGASTRRSAVRSRTRLPARARVGSVCARSDPRPEEKCPSSRKTRCELGGNRRSSPEPERWDRPLHLASKASGLGSRASVRAGRGRHVLCVTRRTGATAENADICLLYTSPSPRDRQKSRMPSSA